MNKKKDLFINAVQLIPVDGNKTIPTIVYYEEGKPVVGVEALERPDLSENLKDNFKIELGKKDPASLALRINRSGQVQRRSPIGIAKDFCDQILIKVKDQLERTGHRFPERILIAEPLSLAGADKTSDAWLSNYRAALKKTLYGKFREIDFMPEPFAVFQYYRYGIKHPLITQKKKHIALVIDFGGGTFDVSVIETTSEGDISQGGRNSRPLSASSISVGGFYINQMIADDLLYQCLEKKANRTSVRKAIEKFNETKNYDNYLYDDLSENYINFFRSYHDLLRRVEDAKVSICSNIANWSLSADLVNSLAYPVQVPINPFSQNPKVAEIRLDAEKVRTIFETKIWNQRLLPAIQSGLKRAVLELGGKSISVALLSGGSSNIRWLKYLIERDLEAELQNTDVVELTENFQEIVAKGLAVECARRHYTEGEGDFRAVTYNSLCLALNPNGKGVEVKKYRPQTIRLGELNPENGVLLPSSSSLRGMMNEPLRWKVKLSTTPTRSLDYFFLRSSFDPDDIENLHNVIDKTVQTPAGMKFGSGIEIELTVRDDGTALPKFIYGKTGNKGQQEIVEGRPFYMDMTFAADESSGDTYLGFDFGTSTSAFSYVKNTDVQVYTERSKDKSWQEISDLVHSLPYPVAYPLARFISETNSDGLNKWGRETLESMLTISAYIAYADVSRNLFDNNLDLFKHFQYRSAGPIWSLLKNTSNYVDDTTPFASFSLQLTTGLIADELDNAVKQVASDKHGKKAGNLDYHRIIVQFGNILSKLFTYKHMGCFEDVRQKLYSDGDYEGVFRSIQGASPPFSKLYVYEGVISIAPGLVYLVSPEENRALCLSPLILSGLKQFPSGNGAEIHLYDTKRRREGAFCFKAVQEDQEQLIDNDGRYSNVFNRLNQLNERDQRFQVFDDIVINRKLT